MTLTGYAARQMGGSLKLPKPSLRLPVSGRIASRALPIAAGRSLGIAGAAMAPSAVQTSPQGWRDIRRRNQTVSGTVRNRCGGEPLFPDFAIGSLCQIWTAPRFRSCIRHKKSFGGRTSLFCVQAQATCPPGCCCSRCLALAARWAAAPIRLGHPARRPSALSSAAAGQRFQTQDSARSRIRSRSCRR